MEGGDDDLSERERESMMMQNCKIEARDSERESMMLWKRRGERVNEDKEKDREVGRSKKLRCFFFWFSLC